MDGLRGFDWLEFMQGNNEEKDENDDISGEKPFVRSLVDSAAKTTARYAYAAATFCRKTDVIGQ